MYIHMYLYMYINPPALLQCAVRRHKRHLYWTLAWTWKARWPCVRGMLQGPTGTALDTWHIRKDMGGPSIGTVILLSSWYLVPGAWYRTTSCLIPGTRCLVPGSKYHIPGTCYLVMVPCTRYQASVTRYEVVLDSVWQVAEIKWTLCLNVSRSCRYHFSAITKKQLLDNCYNVPFGTSQHNLFNHFGVHGL